MSAVVALAPSAQANREGTDAGFGRNCKMGGGRRMATHSATSENQMGRTMDEMRYKMRVVKERQRTFCAARRRNMKILVEYNEK